LSKQIIPRNDVVKRLAQNEVALIAKGIEAINLLISECTDLPVKVVASVFDTNRNAGNEIKRRLHDAGWRVEFDEQNKEYRID
jgi:hypothetical protein